MLAHKLFQYLISDASTRLGHEAGRKRGHEYSRTRYSKRKVLIRFFLSDAYSGERDLYISNLSNQDSAFNFCPTKLSLFYIGDDSFNIYLKYSKALTFLTP